MHVRILPVSGKFFLTFRFSSRPISLRNGSNWIQLAHENNRLKNSLALSKIQPRPPCPPRMYHNLYRYLDSILVTAAPRRSTRIHKDDRNTKNETLTKSLRSAGSNPGSPAEQCKGGNNNSVGKLKRPTYRHTVVENRREEAETEEDLVPKWVMPAIRLLCEKFGASAAPPHIYAGVSSIWSLASSIQFQSINGLAKDPKGEDVPQKRRARNRTKSSTKIPALIVAVSLIVCACLCGKSTSPEEYAQRKILGLDSLRGRFPPGDDAMVRTGREEEVEEDDSDIYDSAHVDEWLREIRDRRLTESDWFKNVGQGTGLNIGGGQEDENREEGQHNGDEGEADEDEDEESWTAIRRLSDGTEEKEYLQIGLGTMVCAAILLPSLSSFFFS